MSPDQISGMIRDGGSFAAILTIVFLLLRREDRWMKMLDDMDQRHTAVQMAANEVQKTQNMPVLAAIESTRGAMLHAVERVENNTMALFTEREHQHKEELRGLRHRVDTPRST